MASYNLQKRADRDRCRADSVAELAACEDGTWPRDGNDAMRWASLYTGESNKEHAAKCCSWNIKYIDDLNQRIARGDAELSSFEP